MEDNLGALAVVEKLTPEIMEKIEKGCRVQAHTRPIVPLDVSLLAVKNAVLA